MELAARDFAVVIVHAAEGDLAGGRIVAIQAAAQRRRPDPALRIDVNGQRQIAGEGFGVFGPGDDVVTHAPGWPTIVEQIKLAGARPIIVRTNAEDGFALTAERLLAGVTPNTRAIVLNSPGNPTGALLSEAEAKTLARDAARRGLWIVADLCYEDLIYDGVAHNLPKIFGDATGISDDGLRQRVRHAVENITSLPALARDVAALETECTFSKARHCERAIEALAIDPLQRGRQPFVKPEVAKLIAKELDNLVLVFD